ncbi:MAG: pyridoxal-phosphate dependent enzyme, partial [Sphingobacteriales bacterium]
MYYIHGPTTMELPLSPIRADRVKNWCQPFGVEADVLRLDELHPQVSGNKWFKLSPWLERAQQQGAAGLLTWGGAWSNHLLATAEACRVLGLRSIGLVRGERPVTPSLTLQECVARGMELHFLSRSEYRDAILPDAFREQVANGTCLEVPEGGYSPEGCAGAARIADHADWPSYTHILAAVGTGTTLAGLVQAALPGQQCIGISVLRNHTGLVDEINALLPDEARTRFTVLHDFHEGGYARHSPALLAFMNEWYATTG